MAQIAQNQVSTRQKYVGRFYVSMENVLRVKVAYATEKLMTPGVYIAEFKLTKLGSFASNLFLQSTILSYDKEISKNLFCISQQK